MLRLVVGYALFAFITASAALAQTVSPPPTSPTVRGTFQYQQPQSGTGDLRVQVHMNLFVVGAADGSDASLKAQARTRQTLYETAAKECEVLVKTLAGECRLDSINVNVQRGHSAPQEEGFNAIGNFAYKITLKWRS